MSGPIQCQTISRAGAPRSGPCPGPSRPWTIGRIQLRYAAQCYVTDETLRVTRHQSWRCFECGHPPTGVASGLPLPGSKWQCNTCKQVWVVVEIENQRDGLTRVMRRTEG